MQHYHHHCPFIVILHFIHVSFSWSPLFPKVLLFYRKLDQIWPLSWLNHWPDSWNDDLFSFSGIIPIIGGPASEVGTRWKVGRSLIVILPPLVLHTCDQRYHWGWFLCCGGDCHLYSLCKQLGSVVTDRVRHHESVYKVPIFFATLHIVASIRWHLSNQYNINSTRSLGGPLNRVKYTMQD